MTIRFSCIFIFVVLWAQCLYAQVNIENYLKKDIDGFQHQIKLSTEYNTGNVESFSGELNYRLDYLNPTQRHLFIASARRGDKSQVAYQNERFVHGRLSYEWVNDVFVEYFIQNEYNEFEKLNSRLLLGAGLRMPVKLTAQHRIYLGVGVMHEDEDREGFDTLSRFRSTNYLSLNSKLSDTVVFNSVMYYQFVLDSPEKYRFLMESSLRVILTKTMFLTSALNYRFDNESFGSVKKYDVSFENGFGVTF